MRSVLALVALSFFAGTVAAAAPPVRTPRPVRIRETFDIRYAPGGGSRHTLDVFRPVGRPGETFPVVLFVHGGTWIVGDKNFFGMYRGVGRQLARQGVVAILCNYRLSPMVRHPEHVRDIARAYAWTYRHAPRYGGDPTRIILAGHSAGAHLASLLATDPSYLHDPALRLPASARTALRGVVSVCGVYRIPAPDEFRAMSASIVDIFLGRTGSPRLASALRPTMRLVGETLNPFSLVFGTDRAVQRKASPLTHVRAGLPPFLLLCAESEVPGLARMANDFATALKKKDVPVELRQIDACSHRTILNELHRDHSEAAQIIAAFIHRHARQDGGA